MNNPHWQRLSELRLRLSAVKGADDLTGSPGLQNGNNKLCSSANWENDTSTSLLSRFSGVQ
jgi:hypothetical protein